MVKILSCIFAHIEIVFPRSLYPILDTSLVSGVIKPLEPNKKVPFCAEAINS